jgi:parvulin-like peptidyl-prolyl isomerase
VGSVSELLEMPYGFHILRVESRNEDRVPPLQEIHDRLRRGLEEERFAAERDKYLEQARADAEWCVKPAYHDRLSVPSPPCPQR